MNLKNSHRFIIWSNSMDQSLYCGNNSHSASQQIPHLLWNPYVHCYVNKSPPSSSRPCVIFCNKLVLYSEELLAPHPTPKLECHPWQLSATVPNHIGTEKAQELPPLSNICPLPKKHAIHQHNPLRNLWTGQKC